MRRRVIAIWFGAAAAGALCAACTDAQEPEKPQQLASAPAPDRAPDPVVPSAPAAREPQERAGGDLAKGRKHYLTYCAPCHGQHGDGDGPLSQALDPKPAKHSDGNYMNGLSDEHLFKVIKHGGAAVGKSPLMASWAGALTDEQIRDVIAFIRSLADPRHSRG